MWRFLPLVVVWLVIVPVTAIHAQKNNNNKNNNNNNNNQGNAAQERRDQEKIKKEQKDVAEAKAKLGEVQKEIRELEANLKSAQENVQKVRDRKDDLEKQLEKSSAEKLGMTKALESQKSAQEDFDYAAKPVLEALQKKPEFIAGLKADAEAKKAIERAKDNEERKEAGRAMDAAAAALDRLKKEAIAASPTLMIPQEKLEAARKVVADLRTRIKKDVAENPQLQQATKQWEQAMSSQEKAKSKLETSRQQLAAIQRKLSAEQSQVQQAIAKDRANDDKGRKKGK
jgi:chromosome segregation ATPase